MANLRLLATVRKRQIVHQVAQSKRLFVSGDCQLWQPGGLAYPPGIIASGCNRRTSEFLLDASDWTNAPTTVNLASPVPQSRDACLTHAASVGGLYGFRWHSLNAACLPCRIYGRPGCCRAGLPPPAFSPSLVDTPRGSRIDAVACRIAPSRCMRYGDRHRLHTVERASSPRT